MGQDIVDIREVTLHEGLTDMQNFYLYWRQLGFTPVQAARRSGYADPRVTSRKMELNPRINTLIGKLQSDARVKYEMDRDRVVEGIMEALSVAREQSDAKIMIQAWTELARITGVQAPEVKEVRHTGNIDVNHMQQASDMELLDLIGKERELEADALALDGEYELVEDKADEEHDTQARGDVNNHRRSR